MKLIIFRLCKCGMSEKYFSKKICIYKPQKIYYKIIFINKKMENNIFFNLIKNQSFFSKDKNYYLMNQGYLFKVSNKKRIKDIFKDFNISILNVYSFDVTGASELYQGFRFTIHTNEKNHKNIPHVHVYKNNYSVPYSLETFKAFRNAKIPKEYRNVEKKIIIPYIKENKSKFMNWWKMYNKDYIVPEIGSDGRQYIDES